MDKVSFLSVIKDSYSYKFYNYFLLKLITFDGFICGFSMFFGGYLLIDIIYKALIGKSNCINIALFLIFFISALLKKSETIRHINLFKTFYFVLGMIISFFIIIF